MACIPAHEVSLIIEETASMDNWEAFIDNASSAISKDLKDESKAYKLKLAYEELISNIIRAAKEKGHKNPIFLRVSCGTTKNEGGTLFTLQTEDNGIKFDPGYGRDSDVNVEQDIDERPIGGLGIFLIKQSVDVACYEWEQGINKNQLSMQLD